MVLLLDELLLLWFDSFAHDVLDVDPREDVLLVHVVQHTLRGLEHQTGAGAPISNSQARVCGQANDILCVLAHQETIEVVLPSLIQTGPR